MERQIDNNINNNDKRLIFIITFMQGIYNYITGNKPCLQGM